jgi:membrane-bound lytic murein transglycosylase B
MLTSNEKRMTHDKGIEAVAFISFFVICFSLFLPSSARADIVVFKNGRTMSVKSCQVDGDMATLRLREGGEVTFPAAIVARVEPDEVPYPEQRTGNGEAGTVEAVAAPAIIPALVPAQVLAARPYADLISSIAAEHHVDVRLVHAVIEQESNYQPRAKSKKGARGLMQLMPETARQYGVSNSYDPKANLDAGVRHLKDLMSRLALPVALAAYNAGEATVRRYGGLPPFPETQAYVRSILRRVGTPAGQSGTN